MSLKLRCAVRVKRTGQQEVEEVEVLYRQHPLQHQFDLAVIMGPPGGQGSTSGPPLSIAAPAEGEHGLGRDASEEFLTCIWTARIQILEVLIAFWTAKSETHKGSNERLFIHVLER